MCLYCEDLGVVFTGHVLLAGGPVPHDGEFPDFAGQLTAIGEHLLTLPSGTRVLPGHGPETTIAAAEKKFGLLTRTTCSGAPRARSVVARLPWTPPRVWPPRPPAAPGTAFPPSETQGTL